jgi:hypothetical protein
MKPAIPVILQAARVRGHGDIRRFDIRESGVWIPAFDELDLHANAVVAGLTRRLQRVEGGQLPVRNLIQFALHTKTDEEIEAERYREKQQRPGRHAGGQALHPRRGLAALHQAMVHGRNDQEIDDDGKQYEREDVQQLRTA